MEESVLARVFRTWVEAFLARAGRERGVVSVCVCCACAIALSLVLACGRGMVAQATPVAVDAETSSDMPEQVFEHEVVDGVGNVVMGVRVVSPEGALPAGSGMSVSLVDGSDIDQGMVEESLSGHVPGRVLGSCGVDIGFVGADGTGIEPASEVLVTLGGPVASTDDESVVVSLDGSVPVEVVPQVTGEGIGLSRVGVDGDHVTFRADSSGSYAIVRTSLSKTLAAGVDGSYSVMVEASPDAGISQDARLEVAELGADDAHLSEALSVLGGESASYARLFDISIMDGDVEVEPAPDSVVSVSIGLFDMAGRRNVSVVHLGEEAEVLDASVTGDEVSFETSSFSIYAVVEVGEPEGVETQTAQSVAELANNAYYISNTRSNRTFYVMDHMSTASLIAKTEDMAAASAWTFEPVEGTSDQFYLRHDGDGGPVYMRMVPAANNNDGVMSLVGDVGDATPFTVALRVADRPESGFHMYASANGKRFYLNMSGGVGGNGFGGWHQADDGSVIRLTVPPVTVDDPAGLDGKTYGLINYSKGTDGVAMMSDAHSNAARRAGRSVRLRTDPITHGRLFVANDSEISQWSFTSLGGSRYHVTTVVDGQRKYLRIDATDGVTLVDVPDGRCELVVTQGSGAYAGKVRVSNDANWAANLNSGNANNGFGAYNDSGPNEWLNLAELSVLTEEDFVSYTAYKVSVSDRERVSDGTGVVVYTRVWNTDTMSYDFFAIDQDGNLVQVFESGDTIDWVGLRVNNLLWTLSEHRDAATQEPNNYYDLRNEYSGAYLAPSLDGDGILSASPVGINLEGRRGGRYFSSVLAWDDAHYEYVGHKVDGGRLVACLSDEAQDFYFAVMSPVGGSDDVDGRLSTAQTIDNDDFGISMRMVDFNGQKTNQAGGADAHGSYDAGLTAVMGATNNDDAGLVTPYLEDGGYPRATATGASLGELFGDAEAVNHLFIESTYEQSGYFEFSSTQNFAHLGDDGDFVVYNQLGTIERAGESKNHGQFMPYNDLDPDVVSELFTNRTNELDQPLSADDPRLDEQLYAIPFNDANFHFGMELEASFTQTASGLDAWGHDIIFEFAGDDDMFFFVDGVLVLDLGGVHKANSGSVNFRTGQVTYRRTRNVNSYQSPVTTDLRTLFEASYRAQHPDATDDEVVAWLDDIFVDGGTVFADWSTHDMKMLYMERGAGASNLRMRFNLASVRRGTVQLSKRLSGDTEASNDLVSFPYQLWYRQQGDAEGQFRLFGAAPGQARQVTHKDSTTVVDHAASFVPAGGSQAYEHVFFVKAGETVVFDLPDDTVEYYAVECGVNTSVYDQVSANGEVLSGTASENAGRADFAVGPAGMDERFEVAYDNHVSDGAMRTLSITKRLFDADGETELFADAASEALRDETPFSFRLYLGDENADEGSLPLSDMYPYHVRDASGNYCRWDAASQRFVSLGISDHEALKASGQLRVATFTTSMNGSISKIGAGYTVEVRDVVVGSKWRVEERDGEIPKGYTLRLDDGCMRVDAGHEEGFGATPAHGDVAVGSDPAVEVRNQRGWGLTVDKVWSDADFTEHDATYFAVYVRDGDGGLTLLDDVADYHSVRALVAPKTSVYYFFDSLQSGTPFSDYVVREVELDGDDIEVSADGVVSGYSGVTPVDAGGTVHVGGTPLGGAHTDGLEYTVSYAVGEQTTRNENVRTDTVTNSRPGIAIHKADWDGAPLGGAAFRLLDADGATFGPARLVSGEDGLVTIAYLPEGDYVLEEVGAPRGYLAIGRPLALHVDANGDVTAVVGDAGSYVLDDEPDDGMLARVTVRDREGRLVVRKVDASSGEALPGAHFALYAQVRGSDGEPVRDYYPKPGFADLVSGDDGIVGGITFDTLGPGTYYLSETVVPEGHVALGGDVVLTITETGSVEVSGEGHGSSVTRHVGDDGVATFELVIPNDADVEIPIHMPTTGGPGAFVPLLAATIAALVVGIVVSRHEGEGVRGTPSPHVRP